MALSVKQLTSAQVMTSPSVSSSPESCSVPTAQSLEPASDSVSPSLSVAPLLALSLSLSLSLSKIKIKKKFLKKRHTFVTYSREICRLSFCGTTLAPGLTAGSRTEAVREPLVTEADTGDRRSWWRGPQGG